MGKTLLEIPLISSPTSKTLKKQVLIFISHNQRLSAVKGSRARTPSTEPGPKLQAPPAVKRESASRITPPISGASFPAVKTSNIDVDAKPIYEPAGKPITEVDMDVGKSNH